MINIILFVFMGIISYAGFWVGAKYGSIKVAIKAAIKWLGNLVA